MPTISLLSASYCSKIVRLSILIFFLHTTGTSLKAEEVLTWEQCVAEALQARPDLEASKAAVEQAEAQKTISASAELPQVRASLSTNTAGSGRGGVSTSSTYSYSLSASQLLYDGGATDKTIRASNAALDAERYGLDIASSNARLALRTAFIELLKAQKLVDLTKEIAQQRKENVELLRLRYEAGREHIGSLRRSEADLAEAEFESTQALRDLSIARMKLGSALGRKERGVLVAEGSFIVEFRFEKTPDFSALANNHPQNLQLEANVNTVSFELDASRKSLYPVLLFSSAVGRNSVDDWPDSDVDWSAGFDISLPLYTGGSAKAATAKSLGALHERRARSREGYLEILDNIEAGWKEFQDAADYLDVQKKYLDAAVIRSKIADAQYSNGLISFDDWVIIENNHIKYKKTYLNAQAQLLLAEAEWTGAKGVTLDE